MALAAGTRIGPYEVVTPLGAGGMGEVYRARDPRLGRDVALKILPDAFALDAERLARFRREAQVLAALNHPHIAAIYGFEEGPHSALVLELVEGPTLADRITAGPIPLDEALPIARQIVDALEAAHEQGIIHRDLKPSNIKITPDGVVKVLDFGLAKITESVGRVPRSGPAGSEERDPAYALSQSPTITSPAMMTGVGMILGTAAYMAPEQAKGRPADKRSDVWAFGCVLYEMLTGRRAFEGDDVSDTMAAVLRAEPDWKLLPANTPPVVLRLLRGCLQKDRKQRIPDIAVVRFELDAPLDVSDAVSSPRAGMRLRERLAWACVATLVLGAAVSAVYLNRTSTGPDPSRITFSVEPPKGMSLAGGLVASFPTISPDGRQLAFVVRGPGGRTQLVVRTLATSEVQTLEETEAPSSPFWSPDSRSIGFFSGGQLKRVDVAGGKPQTLCPANDAAGGTWNSGGVILFTGPTGTLFRVAAAGGEPAAITRLDVSQKETLHVAPWFLPDGRRFFYLVQPSNAVFLASLDSPERKELLRADSKVVYASSGHLLFIRGSTLMAQPFDADRGELAGDAFRVTDNVGLNRANGRAAFSISNTSVLVYWTGEAAVNQPAWFDRSGKALGNVDEEGSFVGIALAPDQRRVALLKRDQRGQVDAWLLDFSRGISTRFTFAGSSDVVWSPDGRYLAYRSLDALRVYRKPVDGGEQTLVWEGKGQRFTESWSPDGRLLFYESNGPAGGAGWILGTMPLTPGDKETIWLNTPFTKDEPHFSPDGHWVAYQSDESGRTEVYVQAFPGPGQKLRVSSDGGGAPRWREDGRELFYLTQSGTLLAVAVKPGNELEVGAPQRLFQTVIPGIALTSDQYDVTGDGERFLMVTPTTNTREVPLTVVVNWTAGH